MKFGPVPLGRAEGKIQGHNVAGRDGFRLLRKGKPLAAEHVAALRQIARDREQANRTAGLTYLMSR